MRCCVVSYSLYSHEDVPKPLPLDLLQWLFSTMVGQAIAQANQEYLWPSETIGKHGAL